MLSVPGKCTGAWRNETKLERYKKTVGNKTGSFERHKNGNKRKLERKEKRAKEGNATYQQIKSGINFYYERKTFGVILVE